MFGVVFFWFTRVVLVKRRLNGCNLFVGRFVSETQVVINPSILGWFVGAVVPLEPTGVEVGVAANC